MSAANAAALLAAARQTRLARAGSAGRVSHTVRMGTHAGAGQPCWIPRDLQGQSRGCSRLPLGSRMDPVPVAEHGKVPGEPKRVGGASFVCIAQLSQAELGVAAAGRALGCGRAGGA